MMDWDLRQGETIRRVLLHEKYGGSRQGGMSPSKASKNVFLFTDSRVGEQFGYFDEWKSDGRFHYTGMGQVGNQKMKSGNAAALKHREEGRAIRLFQGCRGTVVYVGEFEVDPEQPYYVRKAKERGSNNIRDVIIFRLRLLDQPPRLAGGQTKADGAHVVDEVPVEEQFTERAFVQPSGEPFEVERREQKLVKAYKAYMLRRGSKLVRHLIHPPGESRPIFSDLYDPNRSNLLEAKGSISRESMRMAIGQLSDYSRFIKPSPGRAVLVPARPRSDLEALLASQGIHVVWINDAGVFEDNASGKYV